MAAATSRCEASSAVSSPAAPDTEGEVCGGRDLSRMRLPTSAGKTGTSLGGERHRRPPSADEDAGALLSPWRFFSLGTFSCNPRGVDRHGNS
jgi:hypothetical protein